MYFSLTQQPMQCIHVLFVVSMYISTFTNTSILFQPISNVCRYTRFVLSGSTLLCTICQEFSLLGSFEPVCVSQVLARELGWRPRLHNSDGKELLDVLSTSSVALKKLIFRSFSKRQYHKRLAESGRMTVFDHKKCNDVRHSIKPVLIP